MPLNLIDTTPLRNPDGSIAPMDRIKATMQFGPAWFATLEGQDHVTALLGRHLERGYTLFRNYTLPGTELMFPLILVGAPGVFVLNVVNERGLFRAKGDEWGIIQGEKITPARINPLKRTAQFVAVLQKYLEKQGLPQVKVEGILLGANPGLQVDSVRPVARVVMFDALDRFAISVAQAGPALTADLVHTTVARIQNPAPKKAPAAAAPPPAPAEPEPRRGEMSTYVPESMRGYFDEQPQQASELGAGDDRLAFGFNDEPQDAPAEPARQPEPGPDRAPRAAVRKPAAAPRKKKKSGANFSTRQITILGGIFLFWVCLLIGFITWAVINAS